MCFVQSLDFNLPNSLSFTECGGNVSGQTNGVIHSPNYPEKYATSSEAASIQCHWFIHVNPGHKVMMYFETFEVEGNPTGIVIFYTLFFSFLSWKLYSFLKMFWILSKNWSEPFLNSSIGLFWPGSIYCRSRMSIGHFESMALERKRQDTFGIMWGFFGSTYGDHFANQSYESLVSFLVYLPIFPLSWNKSKGKF